MSLLFRELKSGRRTLIFWSICIVFFVIAAMAKFGTLSNANDSMNALMKSIPDVFSSMFGFKDNDISTISGYFGVIFSYLSLIVSIHAAIIGANTISKEEIEKTSEFLLVKPISRNTIVKTKILSVLINLFAINICTSVSSIVAVAMYNKGESINGYIINLMIALFIMQLIFAFMGSAIAAVCKKPKIVGPISTGILMGMYIISIIIGINDKLENLKFITPFKYFLAGDILKNNGIDLFFGILSLIIITILTVVTFVFYKKRDMSI